ncbi:MAG: methyltransferase domain-containing protein [Bryobacteraceae bacterium]|nr:methyltransferase domain-containing protein [Bryobacteraceae bacterium]
MAAEDRSSQLVDSWRERHARTGWWHSFEFPDGTRIDGACDLAGLRDRIGQFPIPDDLRGKRALDIGTWDGWFAFELERRGAQVVAVDTWDNPNFREAHTRLGSRVEYLQADVYELSPDVHGRFDIVLFMGVLYHLKHPLLALERVCALSTDFVAVDSYILRPELVDGTRWADRPMMEFYETTEFGGQIDNWCAPNLAGLMALCRTAGFARVELRSVIEFSACVACHRRWEPPSHDTAAPRLAGVTHDVNFGINFRSLRDEMATIFFDHPEETLSIDDVKPSVGGLGVRPVYVAKTENGWQANFKVPPGLAPGWHEVEVRVNGGPPGGGHRIAVDLPAVPGDDFAITGVADGTKWTPNRFDPSQGEVVSVWVAGLPENADRNNLHISAAGHRLEILHLDPYSDLPRQVNVRVRKNIPPGPVTLIAELAGRKVKAAFETA